MVMEKDLDPAVEAQKFNDKVSQDISAFTKQTGIIITNIIVTPNISPLGDSGMVNISYNVKTDYASLASEAK